MVKKYEYEHHPHTRARQAPSLPSVASGKVEGFNNRLGAFITNRVGTMWAAYVFAALALLSLPSAIATGEVRVIIDWVAQTFLQLVLVSVIMVGQNQISAKADARAEATYKDATALLHEVQQIQEHMKHQDELILSLREELKAR